MLHTFCQIWGLKVNTDKSKIVVFRNGGYLKKSERWYWEGKILQTVTYYIVTWAFHSHPVYAGDERTKIEPVKLSVLFLGQGGCSIHTKN